MKRPKQLLIRVYACLALFGSLEWLVVRSFGIADWGRVSSTSGGGSVWRALRWRLEGCCGANGWLWANQWMGVLGDGAWGMYLCLCLCPVCDGYR